MVFVFLRSSARRSDRASAFDRAAAALGRAARVARVAVGGALVASTMGCLRLKTAESVQPAPSFMTMRDATEILNVDEVTEPSPHFVLEGKPYCFSGTNNYYLTYKSPAMVDDVLEAAKAMNLSVVRLWGFLDVGSLDGAVPSVDDGPKDGVYFQYWDAARKRPAYNDDARTGLGRLDYALNKARRLGLKVIVVLTNNWHAFGGMDQYLAWYGLSKHHEFYTSEPVRKAYKDWVAHLVDRKNALNGIAYRDDPTIFAWELANEARCMNATEYDARGWDMTTLPAWTREMSAYVKSIDPNHMVALGDEGFLTGGGHWTYKGTDGVDHGALLAIPDIDFGTFHLYPDTWGTGIRFGNQWIDDHIALARKLGKPTILEEYGTIVKRDDRGAIRWGWSRRRAAYTNWNELMLRRGGAASLFWMLAGKDDRGDLYPDYDHFSVYAGDATAKLLAPFITRASTSAQACRSAPAPDGPASPFVRASSRPKSVSLR